ncbi:MAG: hypothetical protein ACOCZY_02920 [Bacillota bacterium]
MGFIKDFLKLEKFDIRHESCSEEFYEEHIQKCLSESTKYY